MTSAVQITPVIVLTLTEALSFITLYKNGY